MDLGRLQLSNPVMAASSEYTMSEEGIVACVDAGAAAVVAKSVNENPASARQLAIAEYLLLGPDHRPRPWHAASLEDSLFNQSGLAPVALDDWLALLERCEAYARSRRSQVIGSITVGEPEPAGRIAAAMAEVVGCVELNLSAPHGRESAGAVRQISEPDGVAAYVAAVRRCTDVPLIAKLTAQTADPVALAQAAISAGADVIALTGRVQGFLPDLDGGAPLLGSVGAIGGRWALPASLYWARAVHLALPAVPVIGTNGARGGDDVVRFLLSGASAVEMASAVLIGGPAVLGAAADGVASYLADRGLPAASELVGVAARAAKSYAELVAERAERTPDFPWAERGLAPPVS
jgi:dihydroorotate dehydrogenase